MCGIRGIQEYRSVCCKVIFYSQKTTDIFYIDIQDYPEEDIETFFDNCSVDYLHAALFMIPSDENPQFQTVLKQHCAFLEQKNGINTNCVELKGFKGAEILFFVV